VINVARGALVEESALLEAVNSGRIGGAGLDVFSQEPPPPDSPILRSTQVVATPHIAGVTDGTARRRAAGAADNVELISAGREPLHRVDGIDFA